MLHSILFSCLAGILGTLLGGIVCLLVKQKGRTVSFFLSVAAGFMLAIVCFDLVPESILFFEGKIVPALCSVAAGCVLVLLLELLTDEAQKKGLIRAQASEMSQKEMVRMSVIMLLAIALHNLPEGLVIGSSEAADKGWVLALLIGLHNIPEGMALAAPMLAGGTKKINAILFTGLAGVPTVIGAVVGYLIGSISTVFVAVSLGLAAGAMLSVIFADMLLEAYKFTSGKAVGLCTLVSMLLGILLIYSV